MNDKEILTRLRLVVGEKVDTKLSEILGLSSGAVGNWSNGKPVNIKTILNYFETHHKEINLHWLLTGEGEMMLSDVKDGGGNARYEEIGRLAEELVKKIMEK